jgi:hypothetical protein
LRQTRGWNARQISISGSFRSRAGALKTTNQLADANRRRSHYRIGPPRSHAAMLDAAIFRA